MQRTLWRTACTDQMQTPAEIGMVISSSAAVHHPYRIHAVFAMTGQYFKAQHMHETPHCQLWSGQVLNKPMQALDTPECADALPPRLKPSVLS